MKRIETSILIQASPEKVFAFHADPKNLLRVLPSYLKMEILEAPPVLQPGAHLAALMFIGPLRFDWEIEIVEYQPPHRFVAVQREGPFRKYVHTHLFQEEGGATRLTDTIEYELPEAFTILASRVGLQDRLQEVLEQGQRSTRTLLESGT